MSWPTSQAPKTSKPTKEITMKKLFPFLLLALSLSAMAKEKQKPDSPRVKQVMAKACEEFRKSQKGQGYHVTPPRRRLDEACKKIGK